MDLPGRIPPRGHGPLDAALSKLSRNLGRDHDDAMYSARTVSFNPYSAATIIISPILWSLLRTLWHSRVNDHE